MTTAVHHRGAGRVGSQTRVAWLASRTSAARELSLRGKLWTRSGALCLGAPYAKVNMAYPHSDPMPNDSQRLMGGCPGCCSSGRVCSHSSACSAGDPVTSGSYLNDTSRRTR